VETFIDVSKLKSVTPVQVIAMFTAAVAIVNNYIIGWMSQDQIDAITDFLKVFLPILLVSDATLRAGRAVGTGIQARGMNVTLAAPGADPELDGNDDDLPKDAKFGSSL
jgi:hypothetical protein